MTLRFSLALAQLNPIVGNLAYNRDLILKVWDRACDEGANLLVTPELSICGYPPEDLILRPSFLDAVEKTVQEIATKTRGIGTGLIVGAPWRHEGHVYNAALLLDQGEIAAVRFKVDLPNYGEFDEKRVFTAGSWPEPITFRGIKLGVAICEDYWTPSVCQALKTQGAEIMLSPNASPFEVGKAEKRLRLATARAGETNCPFVCINQVGGQDDLVFDGTSFVLHPDGSMSAQMASWREQYLLTQWMKSDDGHWSSESTQHMPIETGLGAIYHALLMGTRDYARKNNFSQIVLGLSGGIDSALVAALAVDALGAEKVRCLMLPSPYTSQESLEDATEVAQLLGCRLDNVPITIAMSTLDTLTQPIFEGLAPDVTEENIQSRLRGLILMSVSNKFGHLLLTTGNKSEMATGYATLYGDMCGGYAPLKDVYKTVVFALAKWRNDHLPEGAHGPVGIVIPERVLTKAPSAELRPNQTDQDTLPEYAVLDDILNSVIDHNLSVSETVKRGHDEEIVRRIIGMLYRAEYKRRQSPPGPKITRKSFGRDRRYPITSGYRD